MIKFLLTITIATFSGIAQATPFNIQNLGNSMVECFDGERLKSHKDDVLVQSKAFDDYSLGSICTTRGKLIRVIMCTKNPMVQKAVVAEIVKDIGQPNVENGMYTIWYQKRITIMIKSNDNCVHWAAKGHE